jgi:Flp pilus assembly protein TadG
MRQQRRLLHLLVSIAVHKTGTALLEFAIALPVFAMLLFGIFEFGRVLWIENALHYSVQQAARCASINVNSCGSASAIQSYAAGLAGAGIPSSAFSVSLSTSCGSVTGSKVSASYTVPLSIPYFSFSPTLSASSCFPD